MITRKCPTCGDEFYVSHHYGGYCGQYCSDECRTVSLECAHCGNTFQIILGQGSTTYCSPECKRAQDNAKSREYRHRDLEKGRAYYRRTRERQLKRAKARYIPTSPRILVCANVECGEMFTVIGPGARKYCSPTCRPRQARPSLEAEREHKRQYRESHPEFRRRQNEHNHVYRQRNRGYCLKQQRRRRQKFAGIPAPRSGERWTPAEDAIVLRDDITV